MIARNEVGMAEQLTPDICVIGAGAGGLSMAAAAAAFGVPVVLIEKGRMGGECLYTGCVPSKSMIAAARHAEAMRSSGAFGVRPVQPDVAFDEVGDHIHRVIAEITPNDSKERFTGLGVRVIEGEARFRDPKTVVIGDDPDVRFEIKARRFVIATGTTPVVPVVSGIEQVPYFTNETVFETRSLPKHLIVLGGGPVGLELGQAFRRLGSDVTVLDVAQPLSKEDPECAAIVLDAFAREGITVRSGVRVERMRYRNARLEVVLAGDTEETIHGTDLLIAAGRQPNVASLDLAAARIKHEPGGIVVNKSLRTSNRRVYAIGDVIGGPRFTHAASYEAAMLVRQLLFRLPGKVNFDDLPRVTFTDPELAHVGLTDTQARERHGQIRVLRWPYHDNDRAHTERRTRGHIKVVTNPKGLILGASIVGAAAGEQIVAWTLAITNGLNIRAFAEIVMPYPTYSEIGKRAAISFFTPRLTTSWVKRALNFLRRLG
jgi:pyruvate/2-oxoglutarate dehydrogenase complex dihydrolipoamide dehydrogenase (E3) component